MQADKQPTPAVAGSVCRTPCGFKTFRLRRLYNWLKGPEKTARDLTPVGGPVQCKPRQPTYGELLHWYLNTRAIERMAAERQPTGVIPSWDDELVQFRCNSCLTKEIVLAETVEAEKALCRSCLAGQNHQRRFDSQGVQ